MQRNIINSKGIMRMLFCGILALSILCWPESSMAALSLPFSQDFETAKTGGVSSDLPDEWSKTVPDGTIPNWTRVSTDVYDNGAPSTVVSPHGGSYMAKSDIYSATPGKSSLMNSSNFALPAAGNCELSFWMYHCPALYTDTDNAYGIPGKVWGANDSIMPQVSTDNGTKWKDLRGEAIKRKIDDTTTGWSQYTVSLADYKGSTVQVGFLVYADGGYNIFIDDIKVYSTTPANLTASAGAGKASLSWDAVNGATSYKVYKSTTSGSDYSEVASTGSTNYTVSSLNNDTPYYFVVTAVTPTTGEGAYSNQATATPVSTIPAAPTNLQASEASGQVTLSWNAVAGATKYKVFQSTTSGKNYSEVDAGVNKTGTSYTVTGLTHGVMYYFVVTVTTAGGESLYSDEKPAMSSVMSVPTNLQAVAGDGQVTLSWDSVTGANSYKVYKSTSSGSGYTEVAPGTAKTGTSYTVTGLTNNIPYYFVVKSHRSEDSNNSAEICCKPLKQEAPGGSGTAGDPYIINDPYDLVWMSANIATVKNSSFKQLADIDMTGVALTPIGDSANAFQGTYDGCGRSISDLTIISNNQYMGLFGCARDFAVIKNLTLTDAYIKCTNTTTFSFAGGIAGLVTANIDGCEVTGSSYIECVGSQGYNGGLFGEVGAGSIKNCCSTATVTGHGATSFAGGIAGTFTNASASFSGLIQNCYYAGNILGDAGYVGGITALKSGNTSIDGCCYLSAAAANGIGSPASDTGAAPLTDTAFKQSGNFSSWDSAVWYISDGAYPALRAPAPAASDLTITINAAGVNDQLTVNGRSAGDVIKVYNTAAGGTSIATSTVATGPASEAIDIGKLTSGNNSVYVSITASSRAESVRTQRGIPSEPTDVSAVAGNSLATVSFTAPASDGGSAITGYIVTSSPGGKTGTGAVSPIIVNGLTNGTAYTFTVTAANEAGAGIPSSASLAVTPAANSTIDKTTATFDKKLSAQANIVVTMTLNGNTLSNIKNGGSELTEGTHYTVSGSTVTILKSYLAGLGIGDTTLTFNFSSGTALTLTITVSDSTAGSNSTINPTTATFDKKVSAQADIEVTMTLNGNTLSNIKNGGSTLTAGTHYTLSGSTVTILKSYLAGLGTGDTTLTFNFSAGAAQTLTITVSDSTPANSTINPTTAAFDKNIPDQADIEVTVDLNGNTLSDITNGVNLLSAGIDYIDAGNKITILKSYLATCATGTTTLTFNFSAGTSPTLAINVSDSSPGNSTISPTTATFDKKLGAGQDIEVTISLNGNTFSDIANGADFLIADDDYTVSGSTVTVLKSYLANLPTGTTTLTFSFSAGSSQPLTITVIDSTPTNSEIDPTTASFDKEVTAQQDITVNLTLNGNTFSGIDNGGDALTPVTDYSVAGNTVTILKSYLVTLPTGTTTLTFSFSAGSSHDLTITVTDSTVSNSTISPTTAVFDKKASAQADIPVTMTLNGNTLSSIANGVTTLTLNTDYTVTGTKATILQSYLARQAVGTTTLTFNFSAGSSPTLTITIIDTTSTGGGGHGGRNTPTAPVTPTANPIFPAAAVNTPADQAISNALSSTGEATVVLGTGSLGDTAQLTPAIVEALSKNAKSLTVQNGDVQLQFAADSLMTPEMNSALQTSGARLEISIKAVSPAEQTKILEQGIGGASTGLFELDGNVFDLSAVITGAPGTPGADQKIEAFSEPVAVSIDPSRSTLSNEQINALTGIRFEKAADGSINAVKLGGAYDNATGKFTFYTDTFSLYGVLGCQDIKKITMKLGEKTLTVNGKPMTMDVIPEVINNRTMVPIRFVAEALGAKVTWDSKTSTVRIGKNGKNIAITIGNLSPGMDTPPIIKNERTFVPLRFVAEALGAEVLWFNSTKSIQITQ